ncbi:MAG: hypothetical protein ACRD3N_10980 [Terracidiphilus sp.]
MPDSTKTKLDLFEVIPPAPRKRGRPSDSAIDAAIKRCNRAFGAGFAATYALRPADEDPAEMHRQALDGASLAYRLAMPVMTDYESACEFLSCTSNGILAGAIPPEMSGHLLYAVQLAMHMLNRAPKPARSLKD